MNRAIKYLTIGILVVWASVGVFIIARDPLELGPDEGMEHAKALLVAVAPGRMAQEWNDQPWFYSYVFGTVTKANLFCMRLTTLALFMTAAGYLTAVLSREYGPVAGLAGAVSFLSWGGVPTLALSAMCEVPSASLVLLSGLLVLAHERPGQRAWLFPLAGAVAGLGLAIKFTSGLLLPFPAWVLFWPAQRHDQANFGARVRSRFLPWMLAIVVVFAICMLPGGNTWNRTIVTHLKAGRVAAAMNNYAPGWNDFLPAAGTCALAVAAIIFCRRSDPKRLIVASSLTLVFVAIVHSIHRPFWWFYRVQFALPASVLAGVGLSLCLPSHNGKPTMAAFRTFFGLAACCLGFTTNVMLTWSELSGLCQLPRAKDDPLLTRIKSVRNAAGYGYSYRNILLSRAGRLMVPGLTILSQKRFWVNDLDDARLFDKVSHAQPLVMVLKTNIELTDTNWLQMVSTNYVRTFTDNNWILYLRKDLNPVPEKISVQRIKDMGL